MKKQDSIMPLASYKNLVPLAEETWLVQPIAITMMRHNYSLIQNKILLSIVAKLQSALAEILNKESTPEQLSLFSNKEIEKENGISITIQLSDFGIHRNHYPDLKKSLETIVSIPVEIPYKSLSGKQFKRLTNLCDAYIPVSPYEKYVIIHIDKDVALQILSLELGFHRLGKEIVFGCKNKYTQRIYMFISSWRSKGGTIIQTIDLRKMLRLEDKYKNFRQFIQRVLDPAQKELEDLAKRGYSDCYFTYNKKYVGKKKVGEPDQIQFVVLKSPTLLTKENQMKIESYQNYILALLTRHLKQSEGEAKFLSSYITIENYSQAVTKIQELKEQTISNPRIKDIRKYIYTSLVNFFKELSNEKNEIE